MKAQPVIDGLYVLRGLVNVYLLKVQDGYALVDSGFGNSAEKILAAIAPIVGAPTNVRHRVLTHAIPTTSAAPRR